VTDRLFEIEFLEPGAQAFAFTFGRISRRGLGLPEVALVIAPTFHPFWQLDRIDREAGRGEEIDRRYASLASVEQPHLDQGGGDELSTPPRRKRCRRMNPRSSPAHHRGLDLEPLEEVSERRKWIVSAATTKNRLLPQRPRSDRA